MKRPENPAKQMTVRQYARHLRVSPQIVGRYIRDGRIAATRVPCPHPPGYYYIVAAGTLWPIDANRARTR